MHTIQSTSECFHLVFLLRVEVMIHSVTVARFWFIRFVIAVTKATLVTPVSRDQMGNLSASNAADGNRRIMAFKLNKHNARGALLLGAVMAYLVCVGKICPKAM